MEEVLIKLKENLDKLDFRNIKKITILHIVKTALSYFEQFEKSELSFYFFQRNNHNSFEISLSNHMSFEKIKEVWDKKARGIKFHHLYKFVDKIILKENGKTYLILSFYL